MNGHKTSSDHRRLFSTLLVLLLLATSILSSPTSVQAAPLSPSNLIATKITNNRIDLTWLDNSNNETGFIIETATNPSFLGSLTIIVGSNITSYSDTSVYAGETFYFQVMAYDGMGNSASYGKLVGDPAYNIMADFDRNGIVNIQDFGLLSGNYNSISPIEVP